MKKLSDFINTRNGEHPLKELAYAALRKTELRDIILEHLNTKKQISISVAQNIRDIRAVISLRKKIFVAEAKYPKYAVWNKYDRNAIHFLANKERETVGSISVALDMGSGLPIETVYGMNLSPYRSKTNDHIAEIQKLAVLHPYRKTTIAISLIATAYEFIKLCGATKICIFTLSENTDSIQLYQRFGYRRITEFPIFGTRTATCMLLDIRRDSVYEKADKQKLHSVHFARRLAKMFSFNLKKPS